MSLSQLQEWLISDDGIKSKLDDLRVWSAGLSFGENTLELEETQLTHDWQKLLFAASILAESNEKFCQEYALMIAQSAVCYSDDPMYKDAGSLVLSRLSNYRAIELAKAKELIVDQLNERVGVIEQLLWTRRRLISEIPINLHHSLSGNRFQINLWEELADADWLSATAPTAAGKTFIILNWLLTQFSKGKCHSCVFIAPTRALVSEIEKQLNELKFEHDLKELKVTSLPLKELADSKTPFISVFTQERLHIFLNASKSPHKFDIAIIDEAQKVSDERRGVILQDALERVVRASPDCRVVFLSPHSQNPEDLLQEAPPAANRAVVPSTSSTVIQNLLVAEQVPRKTTQWTLSLADGAGKLEKLGGFSLLDRPTTIKKKMAFIALALGKNSSGTLVYVNRADDAEKIAALIYEGLDSLGFSGVDDSELAELSESCKKIIHPKYQLVPIVKRGVAFHYGNMPSIVREEIERLFTSGKIRYLVSTSTLIEGVNLACKTIIVRGPKKGIGKEMSPQDFWNLAGRAGRWGADFNGNIVCVDVSKPDVWPSGLPQKTAYPIKRETDSVVQEYRELSSYLESRMDMKTSDLDPKLEHVAAYLMSWQYREGSLKDAPPIKTIDLESANKLEQLIQPTLDGITVLPEIIDANPGISIVALQRLMNYFREYSGEPERLLPLPPEDDDSVEQFVFIFDIINLTLAPVFAPESRVLPCALTTWDWMRGKTLGQMISARIKREKDKKNYVSDSEIPYPRLIRETMASVEEIARFYAPKYLAAYLSVLRQFFHEKNCDSLFPSELSYDLFLEFGVSTKTLISLISLGLSRTSAVELGEFYGRSDMTEDEVLSRLNAREWEILDLPPLVKREIDKLIATKIDEGKLTEG